MPSALFYIFFSLTVILLSSWRVPETIQWRGVVLRLSFHIHSVRIATVIFLNRASDGDASLNWVHRSWLGLKYDLLDPLISPPIALFSSAPYLPGGHADATRWTSTSASLPSWRFFMAPISGWFAYINAAQCRCMIFTEDRGKPADGMAELPGLWILIGSRIDDDLDVPACMWMWGRT